MECGRDFLQFGLGQNARRQRPTLPANKGTHLGNPVIKSSKLSMDVPIQSREALTLAMEGFYHASIPRASKAKERFTAFRV